MEVIIWKKGVQAVEYYCDSCNSQVPEDEVLWVNGEMTRPHEYQKGFCKTCYIKTRRRVVPNGE